jgi:hypothetical protein
MVGILRAIGLVVAGLTSCAAALADSPSMADPMRPSGTAALQSVLGQPDPANATPVLQALRLRARQPMALISGQWLGLGDSLGGVRIVAIDERGVVLRRDGTVELLKLLSSYQSAPGTPTANKP